MATPLNAHPEWNPASVDGPGQTSVTARSIETHTVLRYASASARDAAFTAAAFTPPAGTVVALDDSPGVLWVYDGSAWDRLEKRGIAIATGVDVLVFNASTSAEALAITFPAGRFSAIPRVVATVDSGAAASIGIVPRVQGVTTSGYNLNGYVSTGTAQTASIPVDWIAIQEL